MTHEEYVAEMRDIHAQLADVAQATAVLAKLTRGSADNERMDALFKRQSELLNRASDCDAAVNID
jgi:hypothetical protein